MTDNTTEIVEVYAANGVLIATEDNRDLANTLAFGAYKVDTYFEEVLSNGIWFMGIEWSTDDRARLNLTSVITTNSVGIPLPDNFKWNNRHGTSVAMNSTTLITFAGYMLQYVNNVYEHSWDLKANIAACNSLVEFDAIDIYEGWPDNNVDGSMP